MRRRRSPLITARARQLRRTMTDEEWRLWWYLRDRFAHVKWRRQEPVGPFIADFVSYAHRLVIEADGSHHVGSESDKRRDRYLTSCGFRVLRFDNWLITAHIEDVLAAVADALDET